MFSKKITNTISQVVFFSITMFLISSPTYGACFDTYSLNLIEGYDSQNDTLEGTADGDRICGYSGDDTIRGLDGADRISGGDGNDTVNGNTGNDYINGNIGHDHIRGGQGNDHIRGGQGNDYLQGDLGNDILVGDRDNDNLAGGDGDDTYVYRKDDGVDLIDDSSGSNDRLWITGTASVGIASPQDVKYQKNGNHLEIQLNSSKIIQINNYYSNGQIEHLHFGNSGNGYLDDTNPPNNSAYGHFDTVTTDEIAGWAFDSTDTKAVVDIHVYIDKVLSFTLRADKIREDVLSSGAAPSTRVGYKGAMPSDLSAGSHTVEVYAIDREGGINNLLPGSPKIVTVAGPPCFDDSPNLSLLYGTGEFSGSDIDERICGSDENDRISGLGGADSISGGAGNDIVNGNLGNDFINGNTGDDEVLGGQGDDTVRGGQGNDSVYGDLGNDHLYGDFGDDALFGGDGDDVISGGAGNDLVNGNAGADFVNGNAGDDIVRGGQGNDTVRGGQNNDYVYGDLGNDTLYGDLGDDNVFGGDGNDTMFGGNGIDFLYGETGDDTINGNTGNDSIEGGEGNDLLRGGKGDDTLSGGDGNDILHGDLGSNSLTGGNGDDLFVIKPDVETVDIITDFELDNNFEKIDIRQFNNIISFDDITISQEGSNSILYLGESQKVILNNINAIELTSKKFVGTWSSRKVLKIYKVGKKFDSIMNAIGMEYVKEKIRGEIKHYVISDFETDNIGNNDLYKPLQVIDLSSFGLNGLSFISGTNFIDLSYGRTLEIKGVNAKDIPAEQFVLSSYDYKANLEVKVLQDWRSESNIKVLYNNLEDKIIHKSGSITYVSQAMFIQYVNYDYIKTDVVKVFQVKDDGNPKKIIKTFNPDSTLQKIDLSEYDYNSYQDLRISSAGKDTIISLSDGQLLKIENVDYFLINPGSFIFSSNSSDASITAPIDSQYKLRIWTRGSNSDSKVGHMYSELVSSDGSEFFGRIPTTDSRNSFIKDGLIEGEDARQSHYDDVEENKKYEITNGAEGSLLKSVTIPLTQEQYQNALNTAIAIKHASNIATDADYNVLLRNCVTHSQNIFESAGQKGYVSSHFNGFKDKLGLAGIYMEWALPVTNIFNGINGDIAAMKLAAESLIAELADITGDTAEDIWGQLGGKIGVFDFSKKIDTYVPVTEVTYNIASIFKDEIKNIVTPGSIYSLLKQLDAGVDQEDVIKSVADSIAVNVAGRVGTQLLGVDVNSIKEFTGLPEGRLGDSIASSSYGVAVHLVGKFATGNLEADYIGEEAVKYYVKYAAYEVGSIIGAFFGGPIGSMIGSQIGQYLSAHVTDVALDTWDTVADAGEDVWEFIGDPVNDFQDLWGHWTDDKWSNFTGSEFADIKYHDGDYQRTHLKAGNDLLFGWKAWNVVFGEQGDDIIFGGDGSVNNRPDELFGGAGDDYLSGKKGNDDLLGGAGSDWIEGGPGNDKLWGGDKSDHFYEEARSSGEDGNDVLLGGEGDDYLDGGPGRDKLDGGAGSDTYIVGNGDLVSDSGTDQNDLNKVEFTDIASSDVVITSDGSNLVFSKAGDSSYQVFIKNSHSFQSIDQLHFNDGVIWNKSEFGSHTTGSISCFSGHDGAPYVGTDGDDAQLDGTNLDDRICGYAGNDIIRGLDGNDLINGNMGNDTINGNMGDDEVRGGAGNDTVRGGNGNDKVYGDKGDDSLYGDLGDDYLDGGPGKDELDGGPGSDIYLVGNGDLISDSGTDQADRNVLMFDSDISPDNFAAIRDGGDFILSKRGDSSYQVRIENTQAFQTIDEFHFSGGVIWNTSEFERHITQCFVWRNGLPHVAVDTNDCDADGIAGDLDAFPFDAAASVDTDGDGQPDTVVEGITTTLVVDTDDDNDGIPDVDELASGLNPLDKTDALTDFDGDGLTNLEEYQQGSNITQDDVPPVLTITADLTVVTSTGPLTPVNFGSVSAWDAKDGSLTPHADNPGPFVPGHHVIQWSATDSAGNNVSGQQNLNVIPLAYFGQSQVTGEGTTITVPIYLNGPPVTYPVTIPYAVSGTSESPSDHDAQTGELVITHGLEELITINIANDGVDEGDETIVLTMGATTNASKGGDGDYVIRITEVNVAPQVRSLAATQNAVKTRLIIAGGGLVLVTPSLSDPNSGDSHQFDWSNSDNALIPQSGALASTFTFDPTGLAAGVYSIRLRVTDSGVPNLSDEIELAVKVENTVPPLTGADSDGDQINDMAEGYGDSDGDGIADYLDAIDNSSLLQTQEGNSDRYLLQTEPGVELRIGETSFASDTGSAAVSEADVVSNSGSSGGIADETYNYPLGLYDFVMGGLPEIGASVPIVISLNGPIPADAVYRKYIENLGWQDFVDDGLNNIVSSAPGVLGVCPAPNDGTYVTGLIKGSYCVQLVIEDGGPNDTDGSADGSISDPGGIAVNNTLPPATTTSSGGGSSGGGGAGIPLLLLLWVIAFIKAWNQRYRFRNY